MIKYKDLKKNDEVRTTQLGPPVSGKLLESPLQGRGLKKTILIYSNGSEVGYRDKKTGKMIPLHNDHGSVYANEVTEVLRDGTWHQVTGYPKATHLQPIMNQQFFNAIKL